MVPTEISFIQIKHMPRSKSRRGQTSRRGSRDRHRSRTPRKHKHREHHHREHHRKNKYDYSRSRKKDRRRSSHSSSSSPYSSSSSSSRSNSAFSSSVSPETRKRRKTPHFQYRVGEKLGHKYKVTRLLGTGTFGRVVEGRYDGRFFAIKVIKPVQKYIDSAKTERSIIKDLCSRDPQDQYHLVRYIQSLYHYSHYCLVFEQLGPSLYDIIKKNHYFGFPPRHLQSFARQLFEAVAFMHRTGYTHTDLKPENILLCCETMLEESREGKTYLIPKSTRIKLIDFGGATHETDSKSSIINTRQYRAPEVILQCCKWNHVSDVWSLGCILVELFTGNLLFHVHDDVDHIYMIDKISGRFPSWMAQRCQGSLLKVFHKNGSINYEYGDRHLQDIEEVMKLQSLQKQLDGHRQLVSLVQRCLQIDPHKRISCQQALRHPYFDVKFR